MEKCKNITENAYKVKNENKNFVMEILFKMNKTFSFDYF